MAFPPWNVLQTGLQSIAEHWIVISIAFVSLVSGACLIGSLLARLRIDSLDQTSRLALGLSGSLLPLLVLSMPVVLFAVTIKAVVDYRLIFIGLLAGLWVIVFLLNFKRKTLQVVSWASIVLILLFCLLVILRLAFIRGMVLPSYPDSVEHYLIVNDFLNPADPAQAFYTLDRLLVRYYHFGFHLLAAWISGLSGAPATEAMPVLGQLLQALIPMAVFFPVRVATKSNTAALFAALLAGLGWSMPSFASNWSKYPALTGLACFPFVLSLLYLLDEKSSKKKKWVLILSAALSGGLAMLAHSRTIILLLAGVIGLGIVKGMECLSLRLQRWFAALLVCLALLVGALCLIDPLNARVLSPYLWEGIVTSLLILILLPFGVARFPRLVAFSLGFVILVMVCLWIPLPGSFTQYGYLTPLDQPFVQMILFMPLSMLGGCGLAGVQSLLLQSHKSAKKTLWVALAVLLCAAVVGNAFFVYSFTPSACCQVVSADDQAAFEWIQENQSTGMKILVPGHQGPYQFIYVDAGMWITPLTRAATMKWEYSAILTDSDTLRELCARKVTHVFTSGFALSFRSEPLEERRDLYQPVLGMGNTGIYQLTGCP